MKLVQFINYIVNSNRNSDLNKLFDFNDQYNLIIIYYISYHLYYVYV